MTGPHVRRTGARRAGARARGLRLTAWMALAVLPLSVTAPAPAQDPALRAILASVAAAPVDTVFARIDQLRAGGEYEAALAVASDLADRLASDATSARWQRDDAALAVRTLERVLALPDADRQQLTLADSLRARVRPSWESGRFEEARAACERQLDIRRRILGSDHPEIATSLNDLGVLLKMQGKFDAAEPLLREALARHRRLRGDEHPEVVNSLNNLSCLLREQGDYQGAEPLAREALARSQRLYKPDDPLLATHLNNLGGVCYYLGDYARAEPLFRQALAIRRQKLGEDHTDIAQSLNNLAFLLKAQGDLAGAEELFREALAVQRRTYGNEHPVVASHIQNLANTLALQNKHAEAVALHREGLEISRRLLGDEHPRIAQIMTSLATSVAALGDTAQAESLLQQALALRLKVLGPRHPDVAWTLSRLAPLQQGRGNDEAALGLYRQALDIRRRSFGQTHLLVARSLSDLGAVHMARGEYAAAETLLAEAARIFEVARLRAGSGVERATFEVSPYRDLAVARMLLGSTADAWEATECAQGRVLADLLAAAGQRRLTADEVAREDTLKAALARHESRIQALSVGHDDAAAPGIEADLRAARNDLLAAQASWCSFEREIALRHSVSEGRAFTLERVQAALTPGTAVLGWLTGEVRPGEHHTWGYVVRDSGPVQWVALDPAARDRHGCDRIAAAASYRRALATAGAWPFHLAETDRIRRDAEELGDLWLVPLLSHLAGIEHVVVVPAGPMLGVPIEALALGDGQLAVDRFAISYAPSATVYAWLRENGLREHPLQEQRTQQDRAGFCSALLVGDPPFSAEHLAAMSSDSSAGQADAFMGTPVPANAARIAVPPGGRGPLVALPRLPGTRAEVQRAAAILPGTVILLGPDASEQNLVGLAASDALRQFAVVHLATHALVDVERPDRSALVLARAGLPDPIAAAAAGERVFDGLVTMTDIIRDWRLTADLVTLSGCQTGLGREVGGEGYVGLAHAFLQAGARCVLVSQWKVDDAATAELMSRFYENIVGSYEEDRGAGAAAPMPLHTALREARRWLRARLDAQGTCPYAHPALWAGFILIGDPAGNPAGGRFAH
jgi:CHAT domain-containing protein/tetratricopeptide (TPR) repeat protein